MALTESKLTDAKKRVLEHLKRRGASTPAEIAGPLDVTAVAARQHLQALAEEGWVESSRRPSEGRGRPATEWRLAEKGHALFPDRHGELTVALLDAARSAFGEEGVDRLLEIRADEQVAAYRRRIDQKDDLGDRVEALAELRTEEGYMAEALVEEDGEDRRFLLVEHHCPICDAARACAGLCAAELEVFRRALGRDAKVQRSRHLLAGDARCVYRVEPAEPS